MSTALPTVMLEHPELGTFIGIGRGQDVVQFRGIEYAISPGRFRQSVLRTELPARHFDATKTGAICPQPHLPYPEFWASSPSDDPWEAPPAQQDEFACLNLTVTAPQDAVHSTTRKVPVFIFIHGGAFMGGSQSEQVSGREIYDPTRLVRHSIALGRSIVAVTINYRVGPLGFLASAELQEYNKRLNEPVGNYGLHDQRRAIEWVSRYIAPFGGDPGNITIQGSSAGASSCHYQSIFPHRKFCRAILASGTITGIGPITLEKHQALFDTFKGKFAADASSNAEAIQRLQTIPVQTFVSAFPRTVANPLIDDDWIPSAYLGEIGRADDPPDLMVGSCAFEHDIGECLLYDLSTKQPLPADAMEEKARSIFLTSGLLKSPETFLSEPSVLQLYAKGRGDQDGALDIYYWGRMISDVTFRIPPLHLARSQHAGKVLVYEFQATNPFPKAGHAYGKANHAINDLFLFDAARDLVPAEHQSDWTGAVDQLRRVWLDFCYGITHWEPMKKAGLDTDDNLNPIYTFVNGGKGVVAPLEDTVTSHEFERWTTVLSVCR